MDSIYLIIVIFLFLLAISDLAVGVINDAVNFLNSAIGSKVAPFKIIMLVAAAGIIVGSAFSNGMMEVARKGIFHPQSFFFAEIMIIFLAVMITDVILLDAFNTFGLPTSTTVSVIFELLGAAVGVAMLKTMYDPNALAMSSYINSANALGIISGILLSVAIAFSFGAIIQYFVRLWFSFNYEKNMKYFGALWGGFAITAITYFILIKGAKDTAFMTDEVKDYIKNNSFLIILYSFIAWTFILQILTLFTKINILKIIVLVGTFALAMAFAGNDLVNFIGVPLAGYESFRAWIAEPGIGADMFTMEALTEEIKTPTIFLVAAGLVMVVTMWFSKKARTVTKTEINLARQDAGYERFGSSVFARSLVRATSNASRKVNDLLPESIQRKIEKRFDQSSSKKKMTALGSNAPHFDLVRASVNLVVSSILIAFGTSMKLPLSTTYVTFMVAMGTSLSDRAWGRESAVYRITGVFSVIGGWFFTAFSAFTLSFLLAIVIYYGGFIAILILLVLAMFFVYRTHIIHLRRSKKQEAIENLEEEVLTDDGIVVRCNQEITNVLSRVIDIYTRIIEGMEKEDVRLLRNVNRDVELLNNSTKELKHNISHTIKYLQKGDIEAGQYYVHMVDAIRDIVHCITYIAKPVYSHVDNNHKPLLQVQTDELKDVIRMLKEYNALVQEMLSKNNFSKIPDLVAQQQKIIRYVDTSRKKQVKRIKDNEVGTRNSMLFLGILSETRSLMLQTINMLKANRDFISFAKGNNDTIKDSDNDPKTDFVDEANLTKT